MSLDVVEMPVELHVQLQFRQSRVMYHFEEELLDLLVIRDSCTRFWIQNSGLVRETVSRGNAVEKINIMAPSHKLLDEEVQVPFI